MRELPRERVDEGGSSRHVATRLHAHAAHTHPVCHCSARRVHTETSSDRERKRGREREREREREMKERRDEETEDRGRTWSACTTLRFDCRTCTKNREPVFPSSRAVETRRASSGCPRYSEHPPRHADPPFAKRFRSIFKWPLNRIGLYLSSSSHSLPLQTNKQHSPASCVEILSRSPQIAIDRKGKREGVRKRETERDREREREGGRAPDTSDAQ